MGRVPPPWPRDAGLTQQRTDALVSSTHNWIDVRTFGETGGDWICGACGARARTGNPHEQPKNSKCARLTRRLVQKCRLQECESELLRSDAAEREGFCLEHWKRLIAWSTKRSA